MTREQYIDLRLSNRIDITLVFEYYLNNCENPIVKDIQTFADLFQQFMMMFQPNLEIMFTVYDVKFNLNILRDENNQIIKVY